MNHWARLLAAAPALAQRTIARAHRISLPHGTDAATRLLRLRRALCPAPAVRAVFAILPPDVQAALHDLRAFRGVIPTEYVLSRYGPVRPWPALAADRAPQSVSEQLVLLGWLFLRPARPNNPAHFLVPPELRRALPTPLPARPRLPAAERPPAPALRAATTLLLACAERPRRLLKRACAFPRPLLHALAARLAPLDPAEAAAQISWLLPILVDGALLETHAGRAQLTPAGERWLAADATEQLATLRRLWVAAPTPDAWLLRLRVAMDGVDWPVLRRRLLDWAAHAAPDSAAEGLASYAPLAAAFGPLGNAQTHSLRTRSRAPWHPRRAAEVWAAALAGPLGWLGAIGDTPEPSPFDDEEKEGGGSVEGRLATATPMHPFRMRRSWGTAGRPKHSARATGWQERAPARHTPRRSADAAGCWEYDAPGLLRIPHTTRGAAVARLLPYARWQSSDASGNRYRLTRATLARALRQGHALAGCERLLLEQAGPLPPEWQELFQNTAPDVRLVQGPLLLTRTPAQLTQLLGQRSVRRAVEQLGPGVARLRAGEASRLARTLDRVGIGWDGTAPPAEESMRTTNVPGALAPGERAALAVACAFYGQHAPPDAPLLPHAALAERLQTGLPPALGRAVAEALDALARAQARTNAVPAVQTEQALAVVRAALAGAQLLELKYDTGGRGVAERRQVQPLALEARDEHWYLRGTCQRQQAERTFRLDRIQALRLAS